MGKILRCLDEKNTTRFFFAFTDDIVDEYSKLHNSSVASNIEMGKILTMNALMYSDLKNPSDSIDIKLKTNGDCGLIISKLYNNSYITGYLENKNITKYDKIYEKGKISKDFIGNEGILVLIRDLGLKTPYIGQTSIISENLDKNFSNYFCASNQTLTSVFLDVKKFDEKYLSFGVMMELLPGYSEKDKSQFQIYDEMFRSELNNYINGDFKDVSFYDYIVSVLGMFNIRVTEEKIIHYKCSCSDEKIDNMLIGLGKKELDNIISDGEEIEVACNFCDRKYKRSVEDVKVLREKL